jgi:hypothetical protein
MDPKDRFDAFMKLADFRAMRWNVRRQVEWKVSLGLWAVMIVSAYSFKSKPPECLLIIFLLSIFLMHTILISQLLVRSRQDINMAFYYIDHAEHVLFPQMIPRERPRRVDTMSGKERLVEFVRTDVLAAIGQMAATGIISVVVYFMIEHGN